MKKNKKSKSWVIKQHRDQFFKKSKILGYRSRAAFKLIELNEKFNFIKENCNLIDLGSSPGSWSQIASKIIKKGKILSLDLNSMEEINNVKFLKLNFLDEKTENVILEYFKDKVEVVLSDMAADTTGSKSLDCIRTNNLCSKTIEFSAKILKNDGVLVSKLFTGEDFEEVKNLAKKKFKKVDFFKPSSSRNESKETYIHCRGISAL
tara:strand:+ start:147 stop:764 length:618 start_codon:yes stop_codon:yes gene_type:complete